MSDHTQDERLRAFLEQRRKAREEQKTPSDGDTHSSADTSEEPHATSETDAAPISAHSGLRGKENDTSQQAHTKVPATEHEGHSFSEASTPSHKSEYDDSLSFDEEPSEIPSLDDLIRATQQHEKEAQRTEPTQTKQKDAGNEQSDALIAAQKAREEAQRVREAKLRSFIDKRRKDAEGDEPDPDDPYGGDAIAKKHLRHLQKYLDRPDVNNIKEIIINKPCEVGLEHADGTWEWVEDPDLNQDQLEDIARMLANRSGQLFHPGNPILSVKMPGGHRVQIVAGFNAPSGFIFSMRLKRKESFGLDDFIMPDDQKEQVKELVRTQKTMLVSGGTGTGKTSFLNAIIPFIPDHERLVSMEDVPELKIPHRNWAPLLFAGNSTAQGDQGVMALLNACLRLRPDRIILGEIRKENAFAFCSAINTGHEGSVATIHANTPKMAMDAVVNRVLMNGDMPDSAIQVLRRQLVADIRAVVQLKRVGKYVHAELLVLDDHAAQALLEE